MSTAARYVGMVAALALLALVSVATRATAQAGPDEPAAIVVYPYVVVDPASGTDTLIQLSNTDPAHLVELRCIYENITRKCEGGQPGESCFPHSFPPTVTCTGACVPREFPDCIGGTPGFPGDSCFPDPSFCDGQCVQGPPPETRLSPFRIRATAQQPLAWHASTGLLTLPLDGVQDSASSNQFSAVPGVGNDLFVGTLRCVAVTDDPYRPSSDNVLVGQATIESTQGTAGNPVGYSDAATYRAIGIKAVPSGVKRDEFLDLGGPNAEYESCPGAGLLDHFFDGANVTTGTVTTEVSTTLVLAPCGMTWPTITDRVAQYSLSNEFAQVFSTSQAIHGQMVSPLSLIDSPGDVFRSRSVFNIGISGSLTGHTRIVGLGASLGVDGRLHIVDGVGGGLHIVAIESHREPSAPDRVQSDAIDAGGAGVKLDEDVLAFRPPRCAGDCNFDRRVSIDELLLGVNMVLENAPHVACPPVDANLDGAVTVNEVIASVRAALNGCPAPVTPPPRVVTSTPTPTGSGSPQGVGPVITHLGVATADDRPLQNDSTDSMGRPVFSRPFGQGMTLIIEARPGQSDTGVGGTTYSEAGDLPDLQILVSRALGDGGAAVCEKDGHNGGIPAVPSLDFSADPATVAAINDLGCRAFERSGRPSVFPFTRTPGGSFATVSSLSTTQFGIPIAKAWAFPVGDTVVSVRVRDQAGNVGPVREMVVRVSPPL
jgi:hypothetical protein